MTINLSHLLCYKLFNIVKLNEQLLDKEMEPLTLSRTQWKIIVRFNFLSNPCTQQQLLMSMGIDRAHLTRALEQLEIRKLITKKRLSEDKRAYHIFLTAHGEKILKKIEAILMHESNTMVQGLNEKETRQLFSMLEKVSNNINTHLHQK